MIMATLYWVRRDFRIRDNLALLKARSLGGPVLAVFIFSPDLEGPWDLGSASRWWLHHSLLHFEKELKGHGVPLLILKGEPEPTLKKLISQTHSSHLLYNRLYEPKARDVEKKVDRMAASCSCEVESFPGDLLYEPGDVMNGQGKPYTVFTPFWKCALKLDVCAPEGALRSSLKAAPFPKGGLKIADLKLLPEIQWDSAFYSSWEPGEKGAWKRLRKFEESILSEYEKGRDFPSEDFTSRLSPHLHFGEITPRQVFEELSKSKKSAPFLREVGWREFARHLLYFFPKTPLHPLREEFQDFPWKRSASLLRLWQEGKTGVPIVDAGMRQLWQTGWMHNRVRMIVGSYLVKDLMIPWQEGAKWFWDTLVDADLANNTLGWQWVGGCGADAAPYFRIFNPVTQGERFDAEGTYVRTFVPELKKVPAKWIHRPHLAPLEVLMAAGVTLGETYPRPVVDHDVARKEALAVYTKFIKRHKK
ncbi:MAG: deoxyribodipyrimidine photo-lyase [Verrucomicrobia bacterium]|nr:deoxyribodipyrimidine photo-lyase [Verrucomicrobiota bacterium]